ncbi:hypothetical protein D3C72_1174490 [compost metagenome]
MEPSSFIALSCTTKYGTRVPSLLVAKCCSMTLPSASKNAGMVFSTSGALPMSAMARVVGVR